MALNTGGLVHPNLLTKLAAFYPSTVTIQEPTETQDASGGIIRAWSDLADHVDLSCRIAPTGGKEARMDTGVVLETTHRIALFGYYPDISPVHRAVVGDDTYDILVVESDGSSRTTYLTVRILR